MTDLADSLKRSFPPVVDDNTRLLVLGSLPGEQSLAEQRYYANPRNHFWLLIGDVIGRDLASLPYEDRLQTLLGAGVGLWDSVGSATRKGSLDAAIRQVSANPLRELVATLPALRAVAFNGGRSAAIGRKALAGLDLEFIPLPSSSPAYTLSLDEKREQWRRLRGSL